MTDTPEHDPSVTFEEALAQLHAITGEMEDGTLGLEEAMTRYEQGIALLRQCYSLLNRAEQKIEMLTGFDADDHEETTPFEHQRAGGSRRKKEQPPEESTGKSLF